MYNDTLLSNSLLFVFLSPFTITISSLNNESTVTLLYIIVEKIIYTVLFEIER